VINLSIILSRQKESYELPKSKKYVLSAMTQYPLNRDIPLYPFLYEEQAVIRWSIVSKSFFKKEYNLVSLYFYPKQAFDQSILFSN